MRVVNVIRGPAPISHIDVRLSLEEYNIIMERLATGVAIIERAIAHTMRDARDRLNSSSDPDPHAGNPNAMEFRE